MSSEKRYIKKNDPHFPTISNLENKTHYTNKQQSKRNWSVKYGEESFASTFSGIKDVTIYMIAKKVEFYLAGMKGEMRLSAGKRDKSRYGTGSGLDVRVHRKDRLRGKVADFEL
jgi:hypothetical protein